MVERASGCTFKGFGGSFGCLDGSRCVEREE